MDFRWILAVALTLLVVIGDAVAGNVVFSVERKFAGRARELSALKSHDAHRHARMLSVVDLPLGGDSRADSAGLYFTKIFLGTPPQDYYVQVDTGSDILWVNCADCGSCPKQTDLGIPLSLYEAKNSSTSKVVGCEEEFCSMTSQRTSCGSGTRCEYVVVYGDGSSTNGHFVEDQIQLQKVTGNLQAETMNGTVIFGCGSKQSGQLGQTQSAVDGIIGFGQSNSSILSQLAAAGQVNRTFAHCLDNINGGGIFAIGNVVSPKVRTTPLISNKVHYNVILKSIDVDDEPLDVPENVYGGKSGGTIIDSGTTLAYLPHAVYDALMKKILNLQPGLSLQVVQESFSCFEYGGNVREGFPDVKFHFDGDLSLTVHPDDYLFQLHDDSWCFGWQTGGMQTKDGSQLTLLGDLVLSNKLVVYDIDNQVIGWTEHNCSSKITVRDISGTDYSVSAHDISSSSPSTVRKVLTFLPMLLAVIHSLAS